MATYKRRIVYLSDEEWAWCSQRAKDHGNTVSAEIRGLLLGDWRGTTPFRESERAILETRKTQQASRDAILRKINRGG